MNKFSVLLYEKWWMDHGARVGSWLMMVRKKMRSFLDLEKVTL